MIVIGCIETQDIAGIQAWVLRAAERTADRLDKLSPDAQVTLGIIMGMGILADEIAALKETANSRLSADGSA